MWKANLQPVGNQSSGGIGSNFPADEDGAALRVEAYLSEPRVPRPLPLEVTDRGLSGLQAAWPPEPPILSLLEDQHPRAHIQCLATE